MSRRFIAIVCVSVFVWLGIVGWTYWSAPKEHLDAFEAPPFSFVQHDASVPEPVADGKYPARETFLQLSSRDAGARLAAISEIETRWQPGNIALLLEMSRLLRGMPAKVIEVLEGRTGQEFGRSSYQWYDYLWQLPAEPHPQLASFKAAIYSQIDPRFAEYFDDSYPATIRLDEILWGGVVRDGIPPLKNPKMLTAEQADYLADTDVVFGVAINGDARAYPKRILAWHEMFKDTVGKVSINGVYCTLCGSMIVYKTVFKGQHYELGTSGFLYRSNKLMYDHQTKSMWSTLTGEPVVGPLVGKGIKLNRLHTVTTTWGEWRRRHPETTVLSLDTGHKRDYGEGVAYHNYFATDRLMFHTPFHDRRLKNKQEVVALRFDQLPDEQLAIDTDYLIEHPVYHDQIGNQRLVVLTDSTGANRVYDPKTIQFVSWDGDQTALDEQGQSWQVAESGLSNDQGQNLPRLPAHRAFWFGWHAAYPQTRLVSK